MSRRSSKKPSSNPLARFRRRHVAERATIHAATLDRDLRIVSHSAAWRDWLGDAPLDGRDIRDVLGPEAYRRFRRTFAAALEGRPARAAAWVRRPPLGPRTIEVLCIPQASETGEIRGFYTLATEIPRLGHFRESELERRIREEEALSDSQSRPRLAVESAEVGTWDWDLQTGTCSWNSCLGRLWGLHPGAQRDPGIFLANIHSEDRGRVAQVVQDLLRAGHQGAISLEFRVVSPIDGTERWICSHLQVFLDETRSPIRLIGTAVDVSARKSMEAALHYHRTVLESQSEAALDGILVVDEAGRMVSFNRRFVEMWQIPPGVAAARSDDAAIASVLHTLVSPEKFLAQVRYLYAHRNEVSRDELRLKDGRTFDRYSAPIRTKEGVNYGRVWFFRDVTEQRRHAQALEEALLELNTFAYSVAHDLRAPLRAIAGYGEMLQEDYGRTLEPEGSGYVARITENARRMDKLILDLLTYSRLTREPMPNEAVPLEPLVSEILARFEPEFRKRRAHVEAGGPFPTVLAHRGSLDQVISNLISNAVRFVSPETTPRIRIFAEAAPDRVRLCVEDNGIGIAREHQDRIFGVFQQLEVPAEYSGTGIGLAIVRRAVERMGGRVGVESEPGQGSRFWIELRRAL